MPLELQPQQDRVADRLEDETDRLLVYHGLGSGKTRTSIEAAKRLGGNYLAVTPASLKSNYSNEAQKWGGGNPEVMSYSAAALGARPQSNPNLVVLDEVQRLRNPGSAQAKAVQDIVRNAHKVLALSGTPIVNHPSDLAPLIGTLTGQEMTPEDFNSRFLKERKSWPSWVSWLKGDEPGVRVEPQRLGELKRLLKGHVDYHPPITPEGVEVNEREIPVDMGRTQRDLYRAMWDKMPYLMRWRLMSDMPLAPKDTKRLRSFMTGPRQVGLSPYPVAKSYGLERAFDESPKLQAAMGELEKTLEDPRKKALIFSNFIGAGLSPYQKALERRGIPAGVYSGGVTQAAREQMRQAYNAGKIRAMLIGPAGAEGLSTKGTNLIQLLDPHFNEARSSQSKGRGLRFDSHTGLPEDLKNVEIQRFVNHYPKPGFFSRLFGEQKLPTSDEILKRQAAEKERLNDAFRKLLQEVGSEGHETS